MESIHHFFQSISLLEYILFGISVFLSILLYFKAIRIKKPVFISNTNIIIGSNITKLKNIEIKYSGSIINNLYVTKIAIWNSGKEPIRTSDIASSDPIIILAKENVIIYDYEVVYQKEVNKIVLTKNEEKYISVSFEFLNFNDGFVVKVYHKGEFIEEYDGKVNEDIVVKGTIIGTKKILKGIDKEYATKYVQHIGKPVDYLINHKSTLLNILGIILALPTFVVILLPFIITLPIDFFYNITHKVPKEFKF